MKLRLRKNSKDLVVRKNQKVLVGPTPEMLIAQAIDRKVPLETMEKLLALMTRVKEERAKEAYYSSLAGFQADCPNIPKTETAKGTGDFEYIYATLDRIVEITRSHLKNHGFSYSFNTQFEEKPPAQLVECTLHHIMGHSETSQFRSPIDEGRMNNIQKSASSVTYGKRYTFCNITGVVLSGEDNDAQDFTTQEGQVEGQNVEYIHVGHSELKKQIEEELKSPVFNNDRATWERRMTGIKAEASLKGMLKRVQRERKDREGAIQSEK